MSIIADERCAFNIIYKFDRNYTVNCKEVGDIRAQLCEKLAEHIKDKKLHFDVISPIPNTGLYYADLLAGYLGSELRVIFEKKSARRTLGKCKEDRVMEYENLLMHVDAVPEGSSVLFIDEAMLSGLTVDVIAKACAENSIINYSFAFASPVTHCHCPWGHIKNTSRYFSKLTRFANLSNDSYRDSLDELRRRLKADEVIFMPYENFASAIDPESTCNLCFFDESYVGKD